MYGSKLQMYIKILCVLVSNGPMKISQMTHKVELDKPRLMPFLSFLYEHCLVGEQDLDDKEKTYFVTSRGVSVLKVITPLIKEAHRIQTRNFEAISSALSEARVNSKTNEKKPIIKKVSDYIKTEILEEI